ncbi:MarR family winged helix-turn-helix transcriptional regulator [Jannaschia sp. CCS1]|uniref:MarR family winged helix-turn-helix transcriptional regulator n=1 Tax=Jannaschia sp. (strain CCS1) TaxID=290400 RepID=UPI000053D38A|nr:MarR family winged helix-turn-helix transcriptional regulator [Jannaschia sp. CCS1]
MTQTSIDQGIREGSFGFLIQTLARDIETRMKAELQEVDVDVRVFANLMFLAKRDGINQREIGARLNFPEYYTSRNVDVLVKAGLAERRPDPDSRRAFLIFLTEAGHAKAAELPPIIRRVNNEFLKSLTDEQRDLVLDLLRTVARGAGHLERV